MAEAVARAAMSDHEQMVDAMAHCVPCKLCGSKAIISDAGIGCGYYIRCENSGAFPKSKGCLISDRRLGGWAYNVMDWWNRLHGSAALSATTAAREEGYRAGYKQVLGLTRSGVPSSEFERDVGAYMADYVSRRT